MEDSVVTLICTAVLIITILATAVFSILLAKYKEHDDFELHLPLHKMSEIPNGDNEKKLKNEKILYIVCNYCHEDAEINISGVTSVYLKAIEIFQDNINRFLHSYNCFLSETFNVVKYNNEDRLDIVLNTDKEHFATLIVNDEVICDWFIKEFKNQE